TGLQGVERTCRGRPRELEAGGRGRANGCRGEARRTTEDHGGSGPSPSWVSTRTQRSARSCCERSHRGSAGLEAGAQGRMFGEYVFMEDSCDACPDLFCQGKRIPPPGSRGRAPLPPLKQLEIFPLLPLRDFRVVAGDLGLLD